MANRAKDWFAQACRDIEQAKDSQVPAVTSGLVLPLSKPVKKQSKRCI
jgi:hypothetical protein